MPRHPESRDRLSFDVDGGSDDESVATIILQVARTLDQLQSMTDSYEMILVRRRPAAAEALHRSTRALRECIEWTSAAV